MQKFTYWQLFSLAWCLLVNEHKKLFLFIGKEAEGAAKVAEEDKEER